MPASCFWTVRQSAMPKSLSLLRFSLPFQLARYPYKFSFEDCGSGDAPLRWDWWLTFDGRKALASADVGR